MLVTWTSPHAPISGYPGKKGISGDYRFLIGGGISIGLEFVNVCAFGEWVRM